MKEDDLSALFLKLSAIFSEANKFWKWYDESGNKWNREGWIFRFREELGKAHACLQSVSDRDVLLLFEQFEGDRNSSQVVKDFFLSYFGERFIEKLRYDVKLSKNPSKLNGSV